MDLHWTSRLCTVGLCCQNFESWLGQHMYEPDISIIDDYIAWASTGHPESLVEYIFSQHCGIRTWNWIHRTNMLNDWLNESHLNIVELELRVIIFDMWWWLTVNDTLLELFCAQQAEICLIPILITRMKALLLLMSSFKLFLNPRQSTNQIHQSPPCTNICHQNAIKRLWIWLAPHKGIEKNVPFYKIILWHHKDKPETGKQTTTMLPYSWKKLVPEITKRFYRIKEIRNCMV